MVAKRYPLALKVAAVKAPSTGERLGVFDSIGKMFLECL
jgi:hypothetical protein